MQIHFSLGIHAALLTPFHADGSCDWHRLYLHAVDLICRGCVGVVPFGTTGEGPSLSNRERIEGVKQLIRFGLDRSKIILANGSSSLPDTVELAEAAIEFGCAGLLAAPPSFYKNISDEGLICFYSEIVRKAGKGKFKMLLYHIPQYSGVPLSLKTIQALQQQHPETIVGVKESEGNWPFAESILKALPHFQLFVGNEGHLGKAMRHGGSGAICGLSNLFPELLASQFKGIDHQEEIEKILEEFKGKQFIGKAKAYMEKRQGKGWERLRPPLAPLLS